jgi:hypothetical protein
MLIRQLLRRLIALIGMVRDGEISQERALEFARLVLRDNAARIHALE